MNITSMNRIAIEMDIMSERFRFRTPIYRVDGKFKKFVYWRAVNGAPAVTCRDGDVFKNPEQCTGLKDKNGWHIYEGDIIQHDTAAGPKCWPIVFKNGCFVLPYESGNAWLGKVIEHCPYDSGVVVVGNIHEKPELLEGNK